MSDWQKVKLGEVATKIGDGLHGTPIYSDDGTYYFINGNNLYNGKILIKQETRRVDSSEYEKYKKDLGEHTLFVSINGTIGNVAEYNGEKCILGKSTCYLNIKKHFAKAFIKYVLLSKTFQNSISRNATGTTIKNVSLKTIREYEFSIPPFDEQKRIAQILSSLDDKIENNNAINKNLEEQAQAIFKSWFIDFEPFGGTMPNDWRDGVLNDICMFNCDSYNAKEKWDFINYLDTSSITKNIISEVQFLDILIDKVPSRAKRKVKTNDIVFSTVRPNQLHYGIISTPLENMLVSTGFSVISAKDNISYHRVYLQLIMNETIEKLNSIAEQATSTFPAIKSDDIASMPTHIIPESIDKEFAVLLEPIFAIISNNNEENQKLSQLRDTLLPKLMSGELRV